jgi:hypothetical protein
VARAKAETETAAARLRAQAEADAARIRADAEAAAARTRSEADAAARAAEAQIARSAQAQRQAEAKPREAAATPAGPDKDSRVASGNVARFDGLWNVTVECAGTSDGAASYTLRFPAQVKDSFLQGDQGSEGTPGWLRLQGDIQSDGNARLQLKGLTGDTKFNAKGMQKGVPYGYQVVARFEGSRGTGQRVQTPGWPRACNLTFVRQ